MSARAGLGQPDSYFLGRYQVSYLYGGKTMQRKRWFAIGAILLCCLLISSCGKNRNEATNEPNKSAQVAQSESQTSGTPSGTTPQLTTRPAAPGTAPSSAATPAPLVVPAGTHITVRLEETLSSRYSVPGQRFEAVLDQPVVVDDQTVLPTGSPVTGHVVSVRRSGRLRHPGELVLTLDSVTIDDRQVPLQTSEIVARGGSHKKRNLAWIGGGGAGGALIGALAAGGKGALIGSGIGAAAGTTTAFITGRKDVSFAAERRLRFRLNHEVSVAG